MARDSSPFAQRLKKALSQRSAGQAQDAEPSAQQPAASQSPLPARDETQAEHAATAPDEQPTGEFPALSDSPSAAGPVHDAPVEPLGPTPAEAAAPVADDEQPTGDLPAIAPSWLDPPATDPVMSAPPVTDEAFPPAPGAWNGAEETEPETTSSVDWAPPADDVYEPAPAAETPPAASSPYLPDPPAPIWEAEAAAAESTASNAPLPIWDSVESSAPIGDGPPQSSPAAETPADATPAWEAEAEAIGEPTGPVVPPPLSSYGSPDTPSAAEPPSDGPTLLPPVLPKKADSAPPEISPPDTAGPDASTPEAAHEAALAALPNESEPEWTPTALHEALSLDQDEAPSAAAASTPSAEPVPAADPAISDVHLDDDAPSPPKDVAAKSPTARRGLRSPFGRRKREDTAPELPAADAPADLGDSSPESAAAPAPEPATSIEAAAAAAPSDVASPGSPESTVEPASETDPFAGETSAAPAAPERHLPEAPADPGSITSRFAAIGRRALSRKEAKAAAAAAAELAAGDRAETLPAATPEPEPGTSPAASVPLAEYKPTFAERAALRRRVKSLRARRDAGLAELGAIVLDQSRFGDPTGGTLVRRRTALLADLDSEIAAIEAALDESGPPEAVAQLGVVHCASCSALVGPADRYCAACGTARPAADAGAARDDA